MYMFHVYVFVLVNVEDDISQRGEICHRSQCILDCVFHICSACSLFIGITIINIVGVLQSRACSNCTLHVLHHGSLHLPFYSVEHNSFPVTAITYIFI